LGLAYWEKYPVKFEIADSVRSRRWGISGIGHRVLVAAGCRLAQYILLPANPGNLNGNATAQTDLRAYDIF
jgi:hypothetical protein